MGDIAKLCLILTVVCVLNGLALGYVYDATRAAIDRSAAGRLASSLALVVPGAKSFSEKKQASLAGGRSLDYYEGFDAEGKAVGYALSAERQGYQSLLRMLVGIDGAGVILGMRVLEQAETPGLGARVDEVETRETLWGRLAALLGAGRAAGGEAPGEPWFQAQYRGLAPSELKLLASAETGGGIHAVTGATVTSRAITDAVRESIELFLAAKKDGGR
ncbi:MAG: RnfABCDGE type electron transport complex subunit G [Candidatus Aureabacteria bacterium]|jgi:electron transport complex protein RnfG|nr:RnfABCDGE type electron transport complex subunit G [Candidatus Auribacterota bacterium]NLW93653.1 RnfABCDGE type electron transport complex subunit G [Chlamydiota bacterium]HOE27719.1 RnfABCDGE type electron transport complex subunit G [bacterium]HQM52961.1 RnfABCDGE type electron transport complex subunit G [bacterium]